MTAADIESVLCDVVRPNRLMKTRGLHVWDLLESKRNFKLPNAKRQQIHKNAGSIGGDCNGVMALAMRGQGMGCKTIAKHFGIYHACVAQIFRSLGLSKVSTGGHPGGKVMTLEEKARRAYEDASMASIRETQKDRTWARHPAYVAWYEMERYYKDPAAHNKRAQEWRKKNWEKYSEKRKQWKVGYFKENPSAKIADLLRSRLTSALKKHKEGRKISAVKNLGCSLDYLVEYLEKQFKAKMTWSNHGSVWHIDHIRPMASFDLTKKKDQIAACHYTNLQPMYAKQNIAKSDQWDGQQEFAHELL